MNSLEMEIIVANSFGARGRWIVPNISWGLGLHECDLLVISKSGYATEVEIKVNRYDLKQDLKKDHGHISNLIRELFFAIPANLLECESDIPERAGIIVVDPSGCCKYVRRAKTNKLAIPLSQEQLVHLGCLASMRIWNLKKIILSKQMFMLEGGFK